MFEPFFLLQSNLHKYTETPYFFNDIYQVPVKLKLFLSLVLNS